MKPIEITPERVMEFPTTHISEPWDEQLKMFKEFKEALRQDERAARMKELFEN
jgi:hypothetical protein